MAGTHYKVIGKTNYDFSTLGNAATQSVILAKAIPVFAYREGALLVRVHSHAGWAVGQSVTLSVYMDGYTDEDPNTDFVYIGGAVTATAGFSAGSDPLFTSDYFKFSGSPGNFGSHVRVVLLATQAAVAAAFPLTISVDLSLKA